MLQSRKKFRFLAVLCGLVVILLLGWQLAQWWQESSRRTAAIQQAKSGKPQDAIPALQSYLERHPDDTEILAALIQAKQNAGRNFLEIEPDLDKLCELRPQDPQAFRTRLELRLRADKTVDAYQDGVRLLELEPADSVIRLTVAKLAIELGRYDEGILHLEKLLSDSAHPIAQPEIGFFLARAYWEKGDTVQAEHTLNRLTPQDSEFPGACVLRGLLHYQAGRYEEAVKKLRECTPKERTLRISSWNYLALALSRLGRDDEAKVVFQELNEYQTRDRVLLDAQQRSDDMSAQIRAAKVRLQSGQPLEASGILEDAIHRLGDDPNAWLLLAECYQKLHRPEHAELARKKAQKR